MEQDNTQSNPEQESPAPVKRGRGRPKGSKNKPKSEAVASEQPKSLEDKMVADGMDRTKAAQAKEEVDSILRKMFNISDTHYDTGDVKEYAKKLNEMSKAQIQAEVLKRGRNALHDTDRNIKILIDLFNEYQATKSRAIEPVRAVEMTPEVQKIINEWHKKVV